MILLAHIMMVPVEEFFVPLAGGAGAGTLLLVKWTIERTRSYRR
jgi:hypothetical protein